MRPASLPIAPAPSWPLLVPNGQACYVNGLPPHLPVSLARGDDAAMSGHRDDLKHDLTDITVRSRRADVIAGLERRRRWSWPEKLKIVAESCAVGAIVSHVAERHGLRPQQLFPWRRQVRDDEPPRVVVEPRLANTVDPAPPTRAPKPAPTQTTR